MSTKPKLKWFREGCDPHEDLHLIPAEQERTEDDDLNIDAAVAWIKIAYDRTRFYNGRGGEGTSRPDSYVAYVRDDNKWSRVITEGTNAVAHVGGIFSDKSTKSFTSLRAAKQAIKAELAKPSAGKPEAAKSEVADGAEAGNP
jgi:hypothetical protein